MDKLFLGICWFLLGTQAVLAQHDKVTVSPAPGWITKTDVNTETDRGTGGSGGIYYLMVDYQDNVERQEAYVHYVFSIQNNEGLQNSSDIQVDFDPSYQLLRFHQVSIYRDGLEINKLAIDQIKTFRKEDNADRFLYDGSIRAVINLTDVRVGDVVEYAYTIRGFNPLYDGRYFAEFLLKAGFPYDEMQVRILASQSRKLYFSYHNGAQKPTVSDNTGYTEYLWITSDKNPVLYDSNTPGWFNPYPYVTVSSFDSWADVVDWALPHYSFSSSGLTTLRQRVGDLLTGSEEDQILQAVRFVQDEIRYLGFESGLSAYKPNDPLTVLKRRFGDCKDKSVLLAAILQAAGIPSHPMLVSSSETKGIAGKLPSPKVFDHCVVRITHNGKDYFIDPTISNQDGNIDNLYFPHYGKGLVLKQGEQNLIDLPVFKNSKVTVKESFNFDEIGKGASFEVETEYYGDRADIQRSYFDNYSTDEITKDYVNYYASIFPSINAVRNVEFVDEDRNGTNKVVVKESYEIRELWQPASEGSQTIFAEFYPVVLQSYLSASVSADRKAPLYIGEPTSYLQETTLKMPEPWMVNDQTREINGDGFRYKSEITAESDQLIKLKYEYHILKESIPADKVAEFASAQRNIQNDIGFNLTYDKALAGFQLSWISLSLLLASVVISLIIARHFYLNYDPRPEYSGEGRALGGWLMLFVIGIAFSPLRIAYDLIILNPEIFNHGIWTSLLAEGNPAYNPELAGLIVFENLYNGFIIVFSVFLFVLLIRRRSSAPVMAIAYMGINLVMQFIDTVMATTLIEGAFTQQEIQGTTEIYSELFFSRVFGYPIS